jgi:hypothetical protein
METTTEGNEMSRKTTNVNLAKFAEIATDILAIDGDTLQGFGIAEMGDGSGRWFGLVDMHDAVNDIEQQYRICSAAPSTAPAWAQKFDHWTVEVRTGETWLELDSEPEAAGVQL